MEQLETGILQVLINIMKRKGSGSLRFRTFGVDSSENTPPFSKPAGFRNFYQKFYGQAAGKAAQVASVCSTALRNDRTAELGGSQAQVFGKPFAVFFVCFISEMEVLRVCGAPGRFPALASASVLQSKAGQVKSPRRPAQNMPKRR